MGYVPPPPPPTGPPDAGRMLREGVRRARITRLQRIVAHITLVFWPTKQAMRVVGRLPFDDADDFDRIVP